VKYKRVTWLRFIVGMIAFVPLLGFLLALRFGAIENYEVTSSSMAPTLQVGDRVFMERIEGYLPRRGDVVVLENPQKPGELLTKRVIGLPGDKIRIYNGYLYVNGQEQVEMYVSAENTRINFPDKVYQIEPDEVFVLGDNRNFSYDSLNFGPAPISRLRGKLTVIYWPVNRFGEIR